MPSTPYDLVQDDQDLRIPLHAEQAFLNGITFQAKYIGSEEVSRPNTRAEIVQAMRRIRYDYKVRNEKKKKVTITVSVDGVKVLLKKRRRKKKQWISEPEEFLYHPIYRIFYVSHDSSDLKIFSYIARDSSTDKFKCAVFKSNKKSQAMRIVRTVGQAFEVCHKFNLHKNSLDNNEERSDVSSDLLDVEHTSEQLSDEDLSKKDQITVTPDISPPQRPNHLELTPQLNSNNRKSPCVLTDEDKSPSSPSSSPSREINKLKDQLEQQAMQTRQALAQLMLVREQLISETNARIEAQARTQQLLQQNRELLEHLASLGAYTDPQATTGLTSANIALAPQSQLQLLFQEPADLSAAMRKAIIATTNNNNLATINQQISNLGSINQQLTTLSHQLSGLNQQSQNLQNFQNLSATLQQQQQQQHQSLTPPQQQQLHQSSLHLNTPPVSQPSSSPIPQMSQLQSLGNQFTNMSAQGNQDLLSKELFQMNQELLNRLQTLNLSAGNNANSPGNLNGAGAMGNNNSPHNSFFYVNPMSCSPNNNSSFNFLSSPSSLGNLTPSPMGTLNRNSYSNSPINDDLGLSIDKNLNSLDENQQFMKPISGSSIGAASNGNLTGASGSGNSGLDNSRSSAEASTSSSPNRATEHRFNTVMLKVTDESGNVTNQRKLSATPSFITRSTSEKVPNRSQMMSQVQRTAWARHTTK